MKYYQGNFKDDKWCGQGICYYENGQIYIKVNGKMMFLMEKVRCLI